MLDWITQTIASLGYVGIALLMLLENILPPIPSEMIMPLAGFTATQGELNFGMVVLAGVMGSILGALPWYYLGKRVGEKRLKRWADRYGKWLTLSGEDIDRSKQWFNKYGSAVVLFGRMVPGIRTYISIPAGLENMAFLPFLLYSTVGTALWVGLLTYLGYVLGQNFHLVENYVRPITALVIALLGISAVVWWIRRKQKQR